MPDQLEPPDSHHLNAAQGWLELGNGAEANEELRRVSTACQSHPAVLEVRWRISQKAQNWDACLELGRVLTELAPHWAMSWVLQAQSYYYQQRPQAAYDTLRPKADAFPQSYEVAYDLACYSSLLGHMEEAVAWLEKAAALGDASRVQRMAETDPDFIPLWEYLGKRGLWA